MFESSKRLITILLIVLTVVVLVLGYLLSRNFLSNLSPEDSQAAGFGVSADRSKFDEVRQRFKDIPCDKLIVPTDSIFELIPTSTEEVDSFFKSCEYTVRIIGSESFGGIIATINPYSQNSVIDDSPEELYQRVHETIFMNVLDEAEYDAVKFFYGEFFDGFETHCIATIYHPINDFEYASIILLAPDFNCAESETKSLAEKITKDFITTINSVMRAVYPIK